jgi:hypothetical protein
MGHYGEGRPQTAPTNLGLWVNADGRLVHPAAPAGGGGPGPFRPARPLSADWTGGALPQPGAPVTRTLDPLKVHVTGQLLLAKAAGGKKPAPRVTKKTTETIDGWSVTVLADVTGVNGIQGAKTKADPRWGPVNWTQQGGRITKFTDPIPVSVTIQTKYGTGKPEEVSAYGRGTTKDDQSKGDVTLGFHESCHRADYLHYLRTAKRPKFAGKMDMTEAAFQQAADDYYGALGQFFKDMADQSLKDTDEVGSPTRSVWCSANPGQCR